MSGCPFDVGDVVVCVDDRPPTHKYFAKYGNSLNLALRKGHTYRVRSFEPSETGEIGILLFGICVGNYVKTGREIVLHPDRFRKIDDGVSEEFREQMRAIKQRKPVLA